MPLSPKACPVSFLPLTLNHRARKMSTQPLTPHYYCLIINITSQQYFLWSACMCFIPLFLYSWRDGDSTEAMGIFQLSKLLYFLITNLSFCLAVFIQLLIISLPACTLDGEFLLCSTGAFNKFNKYLCPIRLRVRSRKTTKSKQGTCSHSVHVNKPVSNVECG